MRLIILSSEFYDLYREKPEILDKDNRPYVCLTVKINGQTFAIPLRHHMRHQYGFSTIGESGLDYSKAVVIESETFIAPDEPRIETKEWNIIKRNENKIFSGFRKYLHQYLRALKSPDSKRSDFIKYSSLQYFEIHE